MKRHGILFVTILTVFAFAACQAQTEQRTSVGVSETGSEQSSAQDQSKEAVPTLKLDSSISKKSIYLYKLNERGAILLHDRAETYFPWKMPYMDSAQMHLADIDSDGKDELIILFSPWTGSDGFSQEDLHVLEFWRGDSTAGEPYYLYEDYAVDLSALEEQLHDLLQYKIDNKHERVTLRTAEQEIIVGTIHIASNETYDFYGIEYTRECSFEVRKNAIVASFSIAIIGRDGKMKFLDSIGAKVVANLEFADGAFSLRNLQLERYVR